MHKNYQVLKPKFRTDEVLREIRDCLDAGWTGIGFKTDTFEKEWCRYSGFNNAHFLNSATAGLHLAIKIFKESLAWQDGEEVITTSLTFVSSNHAILYEKLNPVFADVDQSLCLSPASVERMISSKTRAVMYVGLAGNAENYKEILEICKRHNLRLILDAAHMAGSRWIEDGSVIGRDADCAVFSFQAVKNLPSGDAGMICFQDSTLDALARKLSWLGIDKSTFERFTTGNYKWRYDVPQLGYKYNGNSIMAAICLVSLKYLDEDNQYRRMLADQYTVELKECAKVKIVQHSRDILSSRHIYQIVTEDRDQLISKLAEIGIHCGVHYVANHRYSIYEKFKADVKNADYYSDRLISLPLHLDLTVQDVIHIAGELKKI